MRWEIIYEFYCKFPSLSSGEKNFENRLRFVKVTAMSLVAPFFGTRCISISYTLNSVIKLGLGLFVTLTSNEFTRHHYTPPSIISSLSPLRRDTQLCQSDLYFTITHLENTLQQIILTHDMSPDDRTTSAQGLN